jgi:hypothetical protein
MRRVGVRIPLGEYMIGKPEYTMTLCMVYDHDG